MAYGPVNVPGAHKHDASDISGTLPVTGGGTGAATAAAARENLDVYSKGEVDKMWWLSKTHITLSLSALLATVEAIGSSVGTVTAASQDESVAIVSVNGATVTVSAVAKGSTIVNITSSATGTTKAVAVEVAQDIPSKTLADNGPEVIQAVAKQGAGASLWSVGDTTAPITLNGTVGDLTFSGESFCAFILGFDHNRDKEGLGIHFQFGKTTDGDDVAFVDSQYATTGNTAAFRMNLTNTNSGGWESSFMRTTICPAFLAALPDSWKAVIAACTKYSDNTGGGTDTASYVTATSDKIWLLAEWEVFGARTGANSAEQNYQKQYAYYANGNSRVKYKHDDVETACLWWLRSVAASNAASFRFVGTGGASYYNAAYYSFGFAPGFKVA